MRTEFLHGTGRLRALLGTGLAGLRATPPVPRPERRRPSVPLPELVPAPVLAPRGERSDAVPDDAADPYVVSERARAKTERATAEHARVLAVLRAFLERRGREVGATRLVDALGRA